LLSSGLAIIFLAGRVLYVGFRAYYEYLPWNLFLAWLPYILSMVISGAYRFSIRQWWVLFPLGLLWLIFFPNAPYIITDFTHLAYRPPVPFWYDIGMLATFAWTGCFLAIASLRTMQSLVQIYLGKALGWLFAGSVLVLCGFGIYLGRFEGYNSWDLLSQPKAVLREILMRLVNPVDNLRFFGFTMMFTAFLLVCYLMFISFTHFQEPDDRLS